jgi:hypothetical protein
LHTTASVCLHTDAEVVAELKSGKTRLQCIALPHPKYGELLLLFIVCCCCCLQLLLLLLLPLLPLLPLLALTRRDAKHAIL